MNKKASFLSALDAIQWSVFPDLFAGRFLGTQAHTLPRGWSAVSQAVSRKGWSSLQGAGAKLGPAGLLIPNSSTICFQEIERGAPLTFGVFLPLAIKQSSIVLSPGSELCLQSLSLTPVPTVSFKVSNPLETSEHIFSEYCKTRWKIMGIVNQPFISSE